MLERLDIDIRMYEISNTSHRRAFQIADEGIEIATD